VYIVAAPSNLARDPYLYAVEITNTATKQRVVLRDAGSLPLWSARQAPSGPEGEGDCLPGAPTALVSGIVEQSNSGIGIQMPTLALKVADGTLLTFRLGPERVLLASDLELKPGEPVTVKYAASAAYEVLVALAITNAAGTTVTLRDESGRPGWH